MTIGFTIKEVRKLRKMTLKYLGEQSDLSSSFLCDVEKDRTKPSIEALIRIAKVLDISVSYLLGESESTTIKEESISLTLQELINSDKGKLVVDYLLDFNTWDNSDKDELLKYLEIKKQLRNTKIGE